MNWRASVGERIKHWQTMVNNWRKHNDKQGKSTSLIEPPGYDRDKEMFVAPPSVPSQRQKCDSNEVQRVSAPSMNMRSAERSSHDLIRSHGCTDTLDTSGMLLCEYNNCHDSEEGPRIPHNCVSGRNGSDRLQDGTTSEEFNRPVGSRSQDGGTTERERIVQTAMNNQYMEKANLHTQTVSFSNGCNPLPMYHEYVTALDTDILSKSTEAPNAEIDIVEHCANTGNFDSANPVLQHLYKDASALSLSAFIVLCCAHDGMINVFICQGSFLMAISPQIMTLMNLNGHQLPKAKVKLKLQLTGMGFQKNVKPLSAYSSTSFHEERENKVMQVHRYNGLLKPAFYIVSKDQKNKDVIDPVIYIDLHEVESLFEKCYLLIKKVVDQNTQELRADRRYKEAYAAVRESFGNIRRNAERWRDTVLHSAVSWFTEGAYNSNVRKLMSRGLARFGKGGNGELVEAFQSGERLVIKQTLLRESEWSIVTQMDHPNVMPWFALICGDRSDTKPGQIVSYQVMPKMTEDLSASIRKMGGSIHHYILQLQEAEEPNSVLSAKADLMRQRSAEILRGTLQGLDYMHRQNLVHRDIKASNILLKRPVDCPHEAVHTCDCLERWEVRVADFDSVIHLSVARDRAQRRRQLKVGNTGTSGYRAPEVFFESCTSDIDAKDYYSPASDIWSFGAVCLHLAMGFCCPRHQYQVGLIMLSRHNLVNIPAEEAQEKVDRTVGMYHIRQGFTGEKWQNMINFTARPLEVDWSKRPSAETLLKDPFVKPATTLDNSPTVTSTKDDKNVQRHQEPSLDHK